MRIVYFLVFLAIALAAIWFTLTKPDREAALSAVDDRLHSEAFIRDQSLTSELDKFKTAVILLAKSTEVSNLVFDADANKLARLDANSPAELAKLVDEARMFEATSDENADRIARLEALTGLRNIRVIRRGSLVTSHPPSKTPPDLIRNGQWRVATTAAFSGALGRATDIDDNGDPIYYFFAPVFRGSEIPGIVVAEAPLAEELSVWQSSDLGVNVTTLAGEPFMKNDNEFSGAVMKAGHPLNAIGAQIETTAPRPGWFDPYIFRSIAAALVAIMGYLMWDTQRERRRVQAQLAEAQQYKAARLEDEVREQKTELGVVKDQLALNESLALMGQVSESIGQEIYQPLAAIKNYAEVANLSLTRGNVDLAQKNIGNLSQVTDRISRIIANLRGFVTTEASEVENLTIQPLVHDTAVNMLDRYPNLTQSLYLQVPNDMRADVLVLADKKRLEQVITGALATAWETARDEETPKVIIGLKEGDNSVTIHVDHNGAAANTNSDPSTTFARIRTLGGDDAGTTGSAVATARKPNQSVGFTISRSFMEGMGGKMVSTPSKLGGERVEIILPKIAV